MDQIQASADTGCPCCLIALRLRLYLMKHWDITLQAFRDNIRLEFDTLAKPSWLHFVAVSVIGIPFEDCKAEGASIQFSSIARHNVRCALAATRYEYPPDTGSTSVSELVKEWLLHCTEQHPDCAPQPSPYHPPRLLEIRDDSFRLITPRECALETAYATLSHCWGSAPNFLTLDSGNVERLKEWNSTDCLPKTFRDAALLCYRIGIRYLWIDSLCILQAGKGSAEDWSLHVTEMRTIYSNGLLNIAASRAASADEGMYSPRDTRLMKPAIVRGNNRLICRDLTNDLFQVVDFSKRPGFRHQPLNLRGWVFQERLLSRRVVHFEEEQVHWQCRTCLKCETYPSGHDYPFNPGLLYHLPTTCIPAAWNVEEYRWSAFSQLVNNYCRLELSFPEKGTTQSSRS